MSQYHGSHRKQRLVTIDTEQLPQPSRERLLYPLPDVSSAEDRESSRVAMSILIGSYTRNNSTVINGQASTHRALMHVIRL